MSKKVQLYIRNTSTGPYKIPFKKDAPREVQSRIDGVVLVGKKSVIPAFVAKHVDIDRLDLDDSRGKIKFKSKEVKDSPTATEKVKSKKVIKKTKKEKEKPIKAEKIDENKTSKSDKDSKKGGK